MDLILPRREVVYRRTCQKPDHFDRVSVGLYPLAIYKSIDKLKKGNLILNTVPVGDIPKT